MGRPPAAAYCLAPPPLELPRPAPTASAEPARRTKKDFIAAAPKPDPAPSQAAPNPFVPLDPSQPAPPPKRHTPQGGHPRTKLDFIGGQSKHRCLNHHQQGRAPASIQAHQGRKTKDQVLAERASRLNLNRVD